VPSPSVSSRRPRAALIGALVLALALLAACSSSSGTAGPGTTDPQAGQSTASTGPRDGGTLDIAVPAVPASWAPAGPAWSSAELQAARAVYDRLLTRDVDDVPVPELASAVTANADFTVWTIALRPGVTFHDGTPLDAAAVAANLDAQRVGLDAAALLTPISSVAVAGPATVVVTMATPWSTFPQVLTTQVGYIASPSVVAGTSPTPVGTGPFTYGGVGADGSLTLARNATYWKPGLPHLDAVRFVAIPDAAGRVDAVIAGTVGLVAVDEPRQLSRLDDLGDSSGVVVVDDRNGERPKVNLAFNTGRQPFDHITARRAVGLATDRDEILSKVFDGQGTIARGMLSDASPWFSDHAPPARDVDRARKQAEEYTKETGEPLTFKLMVPSDPTLAHVASLWRVQLAQAGIDLQLEPVDEPTLVASTLLGQYQAALSVGFADPHPDLYEPLFRGIPAEQPAVNPNITRYVNPVVTKAFADARLTDDVTRQVDDYRIVQEQLSVDDPYLFLVQVRSVAVVSTKVKDMTSWAAGAGATSLAEEATTLSLAQVWLAE
jgi:peptide/nickel transport system substrate-binding protein